MSMLKKTQLMKKTIIFVFLIGLLVGFITIMHVKASAPREYHGYVFDRNTHNALQNVHVTLWVTVFPDPTHGSIKDSDYTNSIGYYYVDWEPWLGGNNYYSVFIHYEKSGYMSRWIELEYPEHLGGLLPAMYLRAYY